MKTREELQKMVGSLEAELDQLKEADEYRRKEISRVTSKDELRLQVGHKLHNYGVRGQDNDYLTDYILNLLEGEKQKAYKKGYIDGGIGVINEKNI